MNHLLALFRSLGFLVLARGLNYINQVFEMNFLAGESMVVKISPKILLQQYGNPLAKGVERASSEPAGCLNWHITLVLLVCFSLNFEFARRGEGLLIGCLRHNFEKAVDICDEGRVYSDGVEVH